MPVGAMPARFENPIPHQLNDGETALEGAGGQGGRGAGPDNMHELLQPNPG
jgi:hypothetical protein